ncbi:MAG: hypothetical protein Q8P84_02560 [Deltaproteobacteria bacterium]|nr:hypothetical protein [Deltaproteobacteria bacterium]
MLISNIQPMTFLGLVPAEYVHLPLAAHALQHAPDLGSDAGLLGDALGELDPKAGFAFHSQLDRFRNTLHPTFAQDARSAMCLILPETDAGWSAVLEKVQALYRTTVFGPFDDGFLESARVYLPGMLLAQYVDRAGMRTIDLDRARFLQNALQLADERDVDALARWGRLAFFEGKADEADIFSAALNALATAHPDSSLRRAAAVAANRLADFTVDPPPAGVREATF